MGVVSLDHVQVRDGRTQKHIGDLKMTSLWSHSHFYWVVCFTFQWTTEILKNKKKKLFSNFNFKPKETKKKRKKDDFVLVFFFIMCRFHNMLSIIT